MTRSRLFAAAVMSLLFITAAYLLSAGSYVLVLYDDCGQPRAQFPLDEGETFSVSFVHSVNKTPVTDVYQNKNGQIYVVQTIYYGFGAGVQTELNDGETLTYGADGSMIISGIDKPIKDLSYVVGTVSDHTLAIGGQSYSLSALFGKGKTMTFSIRRRFFAN